MNLEERTKKFILGAGLITSFGIAPFIGIGLGLIKKGLIDKEAGMASLYFIIGVGISKVGWFLLGISGFNYRERIYNWYKGLEEGYMSQEGIKKIYP
jgi:hypothetical protein